MADDLAKLRPNHGGTPCSVQTVLKEMNAKDREALLEAIDNPRIQSAGITTVLRNRGYQIAEAAVARHRRGVCRCHL